MDLFSLDYAIGAITLGSVFFLLQILMDFNRKKAEIRPQMVEVLRSRQEHQDEIDKLEPVMLKASEEEAELQKQIEALEAQIDKLKAGNASDEPGKE